jgi:WXG100 family type VII secretion target
VGGYEVDPTQLARCDAALGSAASDARVALAHLAGDADVLLGGWHGAAGSAFRLGWEHWLAGATGMLDALEASAVALGSSGADYAATEDAVRSTLAGAQR